MGIQGLKKVLENHRCLTKKDIKDYSGKVVAVDGQVCLYQLLATIDAESRENKVPFALLLRVINLLRNEIRPIFVFDGKAPDLKSDTLARRQKQREEHGLVKLEDKMVQDCRTLLQLMGIPHLSAPSEAEAQCAELVRGGRADAVATTDSDALIFGAKVVVTNIFDALKGDSVEELDQELCLKGLKMTRKQLVDLAILLGSDFCPKIKGIGPALAPDLIRTHKNIETVLQTLDKNKYEIPPNFDFEEVRKIFLAPRVHRANQTKIDWAKPREDQLVQFLCSKGSSEKNAKHQVKRLLKAHPMSSNSTTADASNANEPSGDEVIEQPDGTLLWGIRQNVPSTTNLYFKLPGDKKNVRFTFRSVQVLHKDPEITVSDEHGLTKVVRLKTGVEVVRGQPLKLKVEATKSTCGNFSVPFKVEYNVFEKGTNHGYTDTHQLVVRVTNADVESLQPTSEFVPPKRVKVRKFGKNIVPGIEWKQESRMTLEVEHELQNYPLTPVLTKLLNQGLKEFPEMSDEQKATLERSQELLGQKLSLDNYTDRFQFLLNCEEHQMNIDIRNFDMEKVTMKAASTNLLSLEVPGLSEHRPSLLKGDRIFARIYPSAKSTEPEDKEYEGIVHEISQNEIWVGFSKEMKDRFVDNMKFDVRFTFSRFPLRNMHRALEIVGQGRSNWKNWLFPNPVSSDSRYSGKSMSSNLNLTVGRLMEENQEQKLAVTRIVEGGIPGVPYIIFGPPGTGKTFTVVESIKQLIQMYPNSHVLATAPSNYAADNLGLKLLSNGLPPNQILRFYSASRDETLIPHEMKPISNLMRNINTVADLCAYSVIITTVVTAGRMYSAGFPEAHFSHVFVDEAGHAMEPEALIALAGILPKKGGQVVLAGDPKQLGPIVRSPIAIKCGLEVSLLERLMNREIYLPDANNGNRYNNHCITKLLANYRSNEKLLKLPSRLFYNSELYARGDIAMIDSLLQWEYLPKKGFPTIFHGVYGADKREARSPSFFNAEEAVVVVEYVEKLLNNKQRIIPKDIGIISPYRKQVTKIRSLMKNKFADRYANWADIMVGSTEQFQGQEKKVIIISTVRSQVELIKEDFKFNLGFLKNPKRFNVAITRAKALLIVVGNPKILWLDEHWNELLQSCLKNGEYMGVRFDVSSARSGESGDQPVPGSLEEMEQKFKEMTVLPKDHEFKLSFSPHALQDISGREHVEGAEWRSEI